LSRGALSIRTPAQFFVVLGVFVAMLIDPLGALRIDGSRCAMLL